jgi:hypothetical protein
MSIESGNDHAMGGGAQTLQATAVSTALLDSALRHEGATMVSGKSDRPPHEPYRHPRLRRFQMDRRWLWG